MKDLDGKPIPGYKKPRAWSYDATVAVNAGALGLLSLVFFFFAVWLFRVSLNWVFSTEMFTYWKSFVLLLWLLVFKLSNK